TTQRVSKPLVIKNRLYVGLADGNMAAFSLEDGQLLWEQKIAIGDKFIDVDTSPVLIDGQLYANPSTGFLTILNPDTGAIVRRLHYSVLRAPMVEKNRILLGTTDGKIVQLDRGFNLTHQRKLSNHGISSMKYWKEYLAVTTMAGEFHLLDPLSFKSLFQKHLGHSHSTVFGELKTGEGMLAFISSRNRLYVFR
ncbi:MAG: PQQ-binding-like beta-propeller repeat protein, partial [Halobacteriovoraceae bacterium]|nr:PQQ-binding-like beta-propeller repeat protein [Halobacteriovoraceae bacterium]